MPFWTRDLKSVLQGRNQAGRATMFPLEAPGENPNLPLLAANGPGWWPHGPSVPQQSQGPLCCSQIRLPPAVPWDYTEGPAGSPSHPHTLKAPNEEHSSCRWGHRCLRGHYSAHHKDPSVVLIPVKEPQ